MAVQLLLVDEEVASRSKVCRIAASTSDICMLLPGGGGGGRSVLHPFESEELRHAADRNRKILSNNHPEVSFCSALLFNFSFSFATSRAGFERNEGEAKPLTGQQADLQIRS